jgi:hypothetical protein
MQLDETIYIVVPHQMPPRVVVGEVPEDAHDMHAVYKCTTRADLERLANPPSDSTLHQLAKVVALARRELNRL